MKYNLSILRNTTKLLIATFTYIICFVTVLMISQGRIPAAYYLLGIPIILICYHLIQQYCHTPFLYVLLHAIFFIPIIMIPFSYVEYHYLFCIMLFFENIQAILIQRRIKEKSYEDVPWHILVAICIIYMAASKSHLTSLTSLVYYLGLGLIILHFIRSFLSGLTKLVTNFEHSTSMPIKKILLNNTYVFLLFLIIFISISIFIRHSSADKLLHSLGKTILNVIGLIVRFIFYIITIVKAFFATESETYETEQAKQNVEQAFNELREPTLFAQLLEGLLAIATFCLVGYCIYRLVTWLTKLFSKRYVQDTDTIIQLTKPKEITERVESKTSIIEKIKEFFKNDNASKIRRGYRLKIKSYKSLVYKDSDTPAEIAEHIDYTYHEDIGELTQVYEKARYSNEEITFEDVQKGGIL